MTGGWTWIAFCAALLALAPPLCAEGRYRVSVKHVLSVEAIGSLPIGPYGYDGSGNIKSIGADTYKYDSAGRITSGTAADHKQEYSYDAFGNLLSITTDGRTDTRINLRVDAETNRAALRAGESATPEFNAWGEYDAAGNMKSFGGSSSFTYDGAGMVTGTIIDQRRKVYLYTADDERVASITVVPNGTSWAEGESEWTLRGPDQKILRRFRKSQAGDWTWDEDYIYRRGLLLAAEVNRPEKTLRFHPDHLGTPRLITGNGGAEVSRHAYYPFGFEVAGSASNSPSPERLKFTGHERDEVNVDYMHARYYQAGWGRFLSPDPYPGKQREPQSWNRYAYALNNPLKYTDPTGKYVTNCAATDKQCNADAAAFEAARQQDLKSKDAAVVAAAQAYGTPGQANGITVGFGNTGNAGGTTTAQLQGNADGTMSMTATVMIKSGLRGTELNGAVAHEGQHIVDAQGFVNSFTKNAAFWDLSKNLTTFQTEMNAFRVTHSVFAAAQQKFSTGCNGCTLGGSKPMTPADVDLAIRKILSDPNGLYKVTPQNPGSRQFPEWITPP